MVRLGAFVIAAVGAFVLVTTARAADMPDWVKPDLSKMLTPVTGYSSGWYIRFDAGYRFNRMGSATAFDPITSFSYKNAASLGGGAGFKYQWFRADVTADYGAMARFEGTTARATAQPQYTAKIDASTVLANVYFDLPLSAWVTPYVGAGAGFSYLRTMNYTNSALPFGELVPLATQWRFSWAYMGGVNVKATSNLSVDLGYRFLHLGDAVSGTDTSGVPGNFKDMSAHEVRIGLRYAID